MLVVDKAMMMALEAHHGQVNKHNGEPYILHVARVATACKYKMLGDEVVAAAWLHDTVEDTELTLSDIALEFADRPEIVLAVDFLTKKPGVSNEQYYKNLATYPIAARVKVCDIHDNFSRNHLIEDESKKLRMAAKYSLGLDILRQYTWEKS